MKKLIFLSLVIGYTLLLNGQSLTMQFNPKPYDFSTTFRVLESVHNARSNARNSAIEHFTNCYDKAQEYYVNGNYIAAKMYLDHCNRINTQYQICDQETLNKSIKQVNEAIEHQEKMRKAIEKYNNGVEAYLKENYSVAISYFDEAAKWGIPEAQFMLGFCHEYGLGVICNYQKASAWYQKAASQGNESAKTALLNLQMKVKSGQGNNP